MEYIIIGIVTIVFIVVMKIIYGYDMKKLVKITENEELDNIISKYPSNIEMGKEYLKMLGNEKVKIEENKDSDTSLYMVILDKIIFANTRGSYTRIQTTAHECLHSVQDKKMLKFNFIFSNIFMIYFVVIMILAIFKFLPLKMMFLAILILLGLIQFSVKAFLENDAMIKARYLAKEYMEKLKISPKFEIDKIVREFDKINSVGIKCVNYHFLFSILDFILIFSIVCILR